MSTPIPQQQSAELTPAEFETCQNTLNTEINAAIAKFLATHACLKIENAYFVTDPLTNEMVAVTKVTGCYNGADVTRTMPKQTDPMM